MRAILALVAALAACAIAGAATLVARDETSELHVHDTPCASPEVLALIPPDKHDQFGAAHIVVQGQRTEGCWILLENRVFVLLEGGRTVVAPARAFRYNISI